MPKSQRENRSTKMPSTTLKANAREPMATAPKKRLAAVGEIGMILSAAA